MTNDPGIKSIKMKKITIFSVALLSSFLGVTQEVKFGIFAGPHVTSATYSVEGVNQPTDAKVGFHIGATYKIEFDNKLFFAPAISYKLMGYKVAFNRPSFPPDLLAKDNNTTFHEVDVDVLLHFECGKKPDHFFFRFGPSFNFILWGNETFNLETGENVEQSMKFSTTKGYGRYDASLVGQFGYETSKGITIYAHYAEHMLSMNNQDKGPTIRNRMGGITVGKYF
jgi:hypothetical protein